MTANKTVAVFPGAFRPPHLNHYETVRRLAERGDVDEIVIVISNRARPVPGTGLVLDVEVAERIWQIYLRDQPKGRVQLAAASGVRHALDLIDRAEAGHRYLLVVGRKDYEGGLGRFGKSRDRTYPDRVDVTIVPGAPNVAELSASDMRRWLGKGEAGRGEFVGGLPAHLEDDDRRRIWEMCRRSMIHHTEASATRIQAMFVRRGLIAEAPIVALDPGDPDGAFSTSLAGGQLVHVKYANDATSADGAGRGERKPRQRVKAERAAIKWIRSQNDPAVQAVALPRVVLFDKQIRTLVLNPACGSTAAVPLAGHLDAGVFDPEIAATLGRWLGGVHEASPPPPSLWDGAKRDRERWRSALAHWTAIPDSSTFAADATELTERLRQKSEVAASTGFRHLNLTTLSFCVDNGRVGLVDLETATGFGDPAMDLGTLVGHYVHAAQSPGRPRAHAEAVTALIEAYRNRVGGLWDRSQARVAAFTGVTMLQLAEGTDGSATNDGLRLLRDGMAGVRPSALGW